MICILGFYKRLPQFTHEEFRAHWREHGDMIRKAPNVTKYMRKYIQHHMQPAAADSLPTARALDFDGFSECWCESMKDYLAMRAEPDFQRIGNHTGEFIQVVAIHTMMDEPYNVV